MKSSFQRHEGPQVDSVAKEEVFIEARAGGSSLADGWWTVAVTIIKQ
jgi:hypothetical protein